MDNSKQYEHDVYKGDIEDQIQLEVRFRNLMDSTTMAILVLNQAGNIVLANQVAADLFQYDIRELQNLPVWALLPKEHRNIYENNLNLYFDNSIQRAETSSVLRAKRRDGTSIFVEINLGHLQANGDLFCAVFVNNVEQKIDGVIKKYQSIEKLISDFGHDFKTPMSSILMRLHIIDKLTTQDIKKHIDVLKISVNRLNGLVENMLEMARLDAIEEVKESNLNLNELLHDLVSAKQNKANEKNINLSYVDNTDFANINANQDLITAAICHLIHNALFYTKEGSIRITLSDNTQEYIIEIKDTGTGIPKEKLPYVFNRFYKADQARQTSDSLNGLGLAIAKRVAELHDGALEIESELGVGTTVWMVLPK